MLKFSPPNSRAAQRGVGLVELMVGITVGLIVTAGAAVVATRQINEHRRLMLEVQMQQDLRVAADLLQQDLRRAGYRGLPANGVWEPASNGGATPAKDAASSPYAQVTQSPNGQDLFYRYAKVPPGQSLVNTTNVINSNEQFGVRLNSATQALEIALGVLANGQPNWQPITDPAVVTITNFSPVIVTQRIPLGDLCDPACTHAGNCPTQDVRRVDITIEAVSKSDPNVRRTLTIREKLRTDDVSGACPA